MLACRPRDDTKTLTALARAEPVIGACQREVPGLQRFLSESLSDREALTARMGVDLLIGLDDAEPRPVPRLPAAGRPGRQPR